jgi:hypothetical protein
MKPQKVGWKYALLVFGLAILAMMVMDFNSRTAELRRLSAEREQVSAQLAGGRATQSALEADITYATSEAAVVRWAYEYGHMVRPGDIPVVPISPANSTPVPTPKPVIKPTETSNLQRWLSLFVGADAP